ncbi:MAG: metal-dependent transcriptional regulator [Anaerolineales bacterium]|nr:metal-dependent transcriptional regulator [Anaerolineales bacterium]
MDNKNDISNLSVTIQDYLSLIYVLERDNEPVVGAQLAELLEVTPPTVTNTLKRMTRDGLITMTREGTHLTERGWDAARVVMRRHMLMEWMMMKTLPWSKLHDEAHNLEHAISSMAESALMEQLGHPKTCPHGNPLPGNEDTVEGWVSLVDLPVGQRVIIRRIHELAEENAPLLDFFEAQKVMPGVEAVISEILTFNETISLVIAGNPVTLGHVAAKYVFVELAG